APADRAHRGRTVRLVHRAAFEKDRRDDVVAPAKVIEQFGKQVAAALRRVPKMMVWVDDRQLRFERRFARPPAEPSLQLRGISPSKPAVFPLRVPCPGILSIALPLQ